jgi:hypothetical protein
LVVTLSVLYLLCTHFIDRVPSRAAAVGDGTALTSFQEFRKIRLPRTRPRSGLQARTDLDIQEMCRLPQCVDIIAQSLQLDQNVRSSWPIASEQRRTHASHACGHAHVL